MKQRISLIAVLLAAFFISSCAPSISYYPIRPFPRSAKSENAPIPTAPDPPGKPYQLLGIIKTTGNEAGGIGNSQSSTSDALFVKARAIGADALVKGKSQSSMHFISTSQGLDEGHDYMAVAYAIAWAIPSDSTFIPGDTTVQSFIDRAEDNYARAIGKISMGMLKALTIGKAKKSEIEYMLGDPLSHSTTDNAYIYMDMETYSVNVVDLTNDSRSVVVVFQFDRNGILSGKTFGN